MESHTRSTVAMIVRAGYCLLLIVLGVGGCVDAKKFGSEEDEVPAIDLLSVPGTQIAPASVEYTPSGEGLPGIAVQVAPTPSGSVVFRTNRPMRLSVAAIGVGGETAFLVDPSTGMLANGLETGIAPAGEYAVNFAAYGNGGALIIGGIDQDSGATYHPAGMLQTEGVVDWVAFGIVSQVAKYLSQNYGVHIGCPALERLLENDFGLNCPVSFWNAATCIARYAMTCQRGAQ